MIVAIDFDETYTRDPALWDLLLSAAMAKGHRVLCVSARHERQTGEVRETIGRLIGPAAGFGTGRAPKRRFMAEVADVSEITSRVANTANDSSILPDTTSILDDVLAGLPEIEAITEEALSGIPDVAALTADVHARIPDVQLITADALSGIPDVGALTADISARIPNVQAITGRALSSVPDTAAITQNVLARIPQF